MTIRDDLLKECASAVNFSIDSPISIGGKYVPVVEDHGILHISGQVARVSDAIAVQGKVGLSATAEKARFAAQICLVRCLTIAYQRLGSLDAIEKVLQMSVYIQSDLNFLIYRIPIVPQNYFMTFSEMQGVMQEQRWEWQACPKTLLWRLI